MKKKRRGFLSKNRVMSLGVVIVLLISFCAQLRASQSVTLAWNSDSGTNTAGYAVYYGTNSANYSSRLDAGTNTTVTVSGLQEGDTYYFAVTAYNAAQSRKRAIRSARLSCSGHPGDDSRIQIGAHVDKISGGARTYLHRASVRGLEILDQRLAIGHIHLQCLGQFPGFPKQLIHKEILPSEHEPLSGGTSRLKFGRVSGRLCAPFTGDAA